MYPLIYSVLCGIRFGIDILICFNPFQVSSGYMGTYTGIIVPLQSNSKNTADESFRISEKERFLDLEHLFPGQGEERGYKGRLSPCRI